MVFFSNTLNVCILLAGSPFSFFVALAQFEKKNMAIAINLSEMREIPAIFTFFEELLTENDIYVFSLGVQFQEFAHIVEYDGVSLLLLYTQTRVYTSCGNGIEPANQIAITYYIGLR